MHQKGAYRHMLPRQDRQHMELCYEIARNLPDIPGGVPNGSIPPERSTLDHRSVRQNHTLQCAEQLNSLIQDAHVQRV